MKEKNVSKFPNNITLMKFVPAKKKKQEKEEKSKTSEKSDPTVSPFQTCPEHNKPLDLYCLEASCAICNECAIFGKHKGKKVKRIEEIQSEVLKNGEIIDDLLGRIDSEGQESQDMVAKRLKQKRNELESFVKERFNEYVDILCNKGEEIIKQIRIHFKSLGKELKEKDLKENETLITKLDSQVGQAQQVYEEWKKYDPNNPEEICFKLYDFNAQSISEEVDKILEGIHKNYQKKLESLLAPLEIRFDDSFCVGMKRICSFRTQEESNIRPPVTNTNAIKNLKIRQQYTPDKSIKDISGGSGNKGGGNSNMSKGDESLSYTKSGFSMEGQVVDAEYHQNSSSNKKNKTFEEKKEQFDMEVQKASEMGSSQKKGQQRKTINPNAVQLLQFDQFTKTKVLSPPIATSPKEGEIIPSKDKDKGNSSSNNTNQQPIKRSAAEVISDLMMGWGVKFDGSEEDHIKVKGFRDLHSKITDTSASKIGTAILKFKNCTHLQIDVAGCGYQITSHGMIALCNGIAQLEHLRSLDLNFKGSDIGETGLSALGRTVSRLKELKKFKFNLGDSTKLNDHSLMELGLSLSTTSLADIELYLPQCSKITDKGLAGLFSGLSKISRSPGLKKFILNLCQNEKITDSGFGKASNLIKEMTTLEHVEFFCDHNSKLSNGTFTTLSNQMSKNVLLSHLLKTFTLSFKSCSKITKKGLEGICVEIAKLGLLQNLTVDFSYCESIDDDTLSKFSKAAIKTKGSLKSLALSFQGCEKIGENGMADVCLCVSNLTYLSSLKLNVSDCKNVKDEVLSILSIKLCTLANLKNLNLSFSRCDEITNDGLMALSHALKNMPTLEEISLYFAQNSEIGDQGVEQIADSLEPIASNISKLKLNFNNCERIESRGIERLTEILQKCTYLQHLELHFNGCVQINSGAIKNLGETFADKKRLEHVEIYLYGCNVNQKAVDELEKNGKKINKYYIFV